MAPAAQPNAVRASHTPTTPPDVEQTGGFTVKELGIVTLLLAALGWVVFGSHIAHGGFYTDDWSIASQRLFHSQGAFNFFLPSSINPGNRPLLLVYESLTHEALGLHRHTYVALLTAVGLWLALFFDAAHTRTSAPTHVSYSRLRRLHDPRHPGKLWRGRRLRTWESPRPSLGVRGGPRARAADRHPLHAPTVKQLESRFGSSFTVALQ
jgi:hypothetical protein